MLEITETNESSLKDLKVLGERMLKVGRLGSVHPLSLSIRQTRVLSDECLS